MPLLLPDPAELRALAGRIDAHARATRGRADRLGAQLATIGWHGPAASAFHGEAELTLRGLRGAAGRLDDAADALRHHADEVGRLIDTVSAIVRLGWSTMDELLSLPVDALRGLAADFGAGLTRGLDAGLHGIVAGVHGVVSVSTGVASVGGGVASAVGDATGSALDLVGL